MTTSGTTIFNVSRDDVIKAALRSLGVIAIGETPANEDFTNCAFALNNILKVLASQGYLLWTMELITVPMVSGTTSYTIGPSGATVTANRPLRIAFAYIRDANNNDIQLTQLSRTGYEQLTPKNTTGVPVNFYYDPQLDSGVVYFWPTPNVTYNVYLSSQPQVEDIAAGTSSTQNFDLPQEWFQPLRWLLASEVGPEYMSNLPKLQMVQQRASDAMNTIANFGQEQTSVYFTVDPQR